jgi:AcrR family transcriptional regulator
MARSAGSVDVAYPSRTKHRLATRDRLFDAALDEFRRVGVAAAQIEAIVRAAGVARGTFYLHFPTKDAVLVELLARKQRILAERLSRGTTPASTTSFLHRVADLMLQDARAEDRALWHELLGAIARRGSELRHDARALVSAVTDFLSAARDRGELRRDLDPTELATVCLTGLYGLLQLKLGSPLPEARAALHHAVDVFVRGTRPGGT